MIGCINFWKKQRDGKPIPFQERDSSPQYTLLYIEEKYLSLSLSWSLSGLHCFTRLATVLSLVLVFGSEEEKKKKKF